VNLENVRATYSYHSGKTSDIVRQLGFVGMAVVWVFKTDLAGKPTIPTDLLPAAILIVMGLTLDLLQYVVCSAVWGIYNRIKERNVDKDCDFLAPRQINWPALTFFWSKTIVMVVAYLLILRFLYGRLVLTL
jgi:hypothetical protein